MRLRPRSLTAAAVTLSVSLALVACGADDDAGSAGSSSTSSASPGEGSASPGAEEGAPSTAAESDGASSGAAAKAPAAGSTVSPAAFTEMLGTSMTEGRTASLEMKVTGDNGSTSRGEADFAAKPPAIALTTSVKALGGQKTEVIMVDGTIYMQMGAGTGGKYAKMDLSEMGQGDFTQFDPAASFKQLAKVFSEVTYVGEEKVDGEQLRHYRAVVDQKKTKKAAGAPTVSDYDAWFDDQGRIRSIKLDLGNGTRSTMTYSDWGKKVDITAPPASKVVEMPQMPQSPPVSE